MPTAVPVTAVVAPAVAVPDPNPINQLHLTHLIHLTTAPYISCPHRAGYDGEYALPS
jgi:hypothetical protein